jgi:hypothetical protein
MKHLFFCILLITGLSSEAQTISKTTSSPISRAVCPETYTYYTLSLGNPYSGCDIVWSAVNGTIITQSNKKVTVEWDDKPGAIAELYATTNTCASSNHTFSKKELILSIKDQEWGSYNNSVNIDFCIKAQVNLAVPRMFVQGTGGIGQPTLTEVIYGWTIPSGWKEVGTGKTGFIPISRHYISIEPDKCSKPGIVKVQGFINDASICGSASPSKIATISLNGVTPVATVSPQAGYSGASFCNTNPVTFYATTNSVFNCIGSLSWSYSSSWTKLSQTGNSITLRPSGSPSDASSIGATISFSCGSSITSSYTPTYAQNEITGPNLICSTGTFILQNPPANHTITWTSSNPSGLNIDLNNGFATRLNNFGGQVIITAGLNGACTANFTKSVNVGNYPPAGTSSINSNCSGNSFNVLNTNLSSACTANTPIYFTYRITDPNYSNFIFTPVSVPSGASWSFNGGNLYMTVTTPPSQGMRSATIALSATGPCGPYNLTFTSTAVNYYSSFFSISPNPSQENVTVGMNNENLLNDGSQYLIYAIKITDAFGTPVESFEYKVGINSAKISLQNFNPGLYILSVFDGNKWSSERLIIEK